jgi:hypothetical protein
MTLGFCKMLGGDAASQAQSPLSIINVDMRIRRSSVRIISRLYSIMRSRLCWVSVMPTTASVLSITGRMNGFATQTPATSQSLSPRSYRDAIRL